MARNESNGAPRRFTDWLRRQQESQKPQPEPAEPAAQPDDGEADSRARQTMILAFLKDPSSDPIFRDRALVYRLFSEERTFQQRRMEQLTAEIAEVGDADAERLAGLREQLAYAEDLHRRMFVLLKRVMGVQGKTGGTGKLRKRGTQPGMSLEDRLSVVFDEPPDEPQA